MIVSTGNREAIKLYREIMRTLRHFTHTNEQGIPWKVILRDSVRNEYENSKFETDPHKQVEMIMVGRDCLMRIQHGMLTGKIDKDPESGGTGNPFQKV
ncbi:hypothetical protein PPL_07326 [Heterostelium album PN500]|uniref:Complex 1 LYR protein domain-containing protein n=1 Tax=Heterostelium pallidum (strain ATCC 26659 / Pp 5 / PN500) TaxID=670386 RepID=D3BF09_HETP5|nr:hypothetical protein PPL_07326 [Heterostelium album PN500]EFA80490.1 hypothetical protein PPL_07326 [Heterostelium album PN500]|eukprot:XP_020432610.1 hypothetical protein PPL_07326 [Heterostelium album PN500]